MMKGEREVVDDWLNKAQVIGSGLVPEAVTAAAHRFFAELGHAKSRRIPRRPMGLAR